MKALDMIDAIVKAIRASKDRARGPDRADGASRFEFSEIQANHILDMPLGRLTQLGREELDKETQRARGAGQGAAAHPRQARRADGRDPRRARRDPRRAQGAAPHARSSPTTPARSTSSRSWKTSRTSVTVTARGYVRAVPERTRKALVANAGERDAVAQVIETTALAGVLFFTDRGRAYRATVHELPKERLTAAQNLFQFGDGEKVDRGARRPVARGASRTSCS